MGVSTQSTWGQAMQKEFDERLEVRTQQIEVDCRVELQREKERFEGTVREMEAKLVDQRVQNETQMAVLERECREKLEQSERRKGQTKRAMRYAEVSSESECESDETQLTR